MELYTAGTGNGQRAAIAVNECGVSCKIHVLNLGQGEQKAADYAPTNQNIFFLGARMPEKVPDSAIKFYEDRFVNLWRFADEQLAKTQYLAGDEITAADLAVYPIYAGRNTLPDNAGLKHLQAWGERIGWRPGVQKGMKLEN